MRYYKYHSVSDIVTQWDVCVAYVWCVIKLILTDTLYDIAFHIIVLCGL